MIIKKNDINSLKRNANNTMSKRYEFLLKEYKSDDRQKCPTLSNSQIMRQIISLLKHLKKIKKSKEKQSK